MIFFFQYCHPACAFFKIVRNVNLPVLPAGLQIMADQGFEHRHPILVLPWANQPQVARIMRRRVFETKKHIMSLPFFSNA